MALTEAERVELANMLYETLDPEAAGHYEAEWKPELEQRIEELDSEKVESVPWEEVRRMIRG